METRSCGSLDVPSASSVRRVREASGDGWLHGDCDQNALWYRSDSEAWLDIESYKVQRCGCCTRSWLPVKLQSESEEHSALSRQTDTGFASRFEHLRPTRRSSSPKEVLLLKCDFMNRAHEESIDSHSENVCESFHAGLYTFRPASVLDCPGGSPTADSS